MIKWRKILIAFSLVAGIFLLQKFLLSNRDDSKESSDPSSNAQKNSPSSLHTPGSSPANPGDSTAQKGEESANIIDRRGKTGERLIVTQAVSSLTYEKLKQTLAEKFGKNLIALEANFEGIYGRAIIHDKHWSGDARETALKLMRENPALLAGLPPQTEVYIHDVRRSNLGTLVIFSGDYQGFLYPGVKVVEFDNSSSSETSVNGLQGIKDSTVFLHNVDDCTGTPSSPEQAQSAVRHYHQNQVAEFVSVQKQIFPDGGRTGTKIYVVNYKLKTSLSEVHSYSAAVEYCTGQVRMTHRTDMQD